MRKTATNDVAKDILNRAKTVRPRFHFGMIIFEVDVHDRRTETNLRDQAKILMNEILVAFSAATVEVLCGGGINRRTYRQERTFRVILCHLVNGFGDKFSDAHDVVSHSNLTLKLYSEIFTTGCRIIPAGLPTGVPAASVPVRSPSAFLEAYPNVSGQPWHESDASVGPTSHRTVKRPAYAVASRSRAW